RHGRVVREHRATPLLQRRERGDFARPRRRPRLVTSMKNHGILLVSVLASMAGCAAYMRVMTPKPQTADNPLVSGQPLVVTSKADVGTVQEQDCNTWPFEDTQTVTITA